MARSRKEHPYNFDFDLFGEAVLTSTHDFYVEQKCEKYHNFQKTVKFYSKKNHSMSIGSLCNDFNMSLVMRKPDLYICESKDADQLRGNREADQRLCFRYIHVIKVISERFQSHFSEYALMILK